MVQENAFLAIAGSEGAGDLLASLEALEIPAAIVGPQQEILTTNAAFVRAAGEQGILIDEGTFRAGSAGIVETMREAMAAANREGRAERGLPGRAVRILAHQLLTEAPDGRLLITLRPRVTVDGASALNLTNVEDSLVRMLADGQNLREAALMLKMPYNTARKYVHNMLSRTASKTQAHLVARYLGR